jgi:4-carboxymuconolactone decarboxylase
MFDLQDVPLVSPALDHFTHSVLLGEVWTRPTLSPRDRSLVTLAALIARNQSLALPYYFKLALDNGVTPGEVSEIITHLAFYSGFPNAMGAVESVKDIFAAREIRPGRLPPVAPTLLPIDAAAEKKRAEQVEQTVGPVSQGLVHYTGELLFRNLWLRPDLAPRDRSLVTVSALVAAGQVAQVTFHLNKAMDNGLSQLQASEVLTHLAFYAGWPNAMSAVPVFGDVFAKRAQ